MRNVLLICFAMATEMTVATTISPDSLRFEKDGGDGSVTTFGDGIWMATSDSSWISIKNSFGQDGELCGYNVGENLSCESRTGTITLAGAIHTIYQAGYIASVSPVKIECDYTGMSGVFNIAVEEVASWAVNSEDEWVSVAGAASGNGNGTVPFKVKSNESLNARRTVLRVAGKTVVVIQDGVDVIVNLSKIEVESDAAIVKLNVNALDSTSWSVSCENEPWFHLSSFGGTGTQVLNVTIDANPSIEDRISSFRVGSREITLVQHGIRKVQIKTTPQSAIHGYGAENEAFNVICPIAATWQSTSQDDWLFVESHQTGSGNGEVEYGLSENPTLIQRTGTICISPLTVPVSEDVNLSGTEKFVKFKLGESVKGYDGYVAKDRMYDVSTNGWVVRRDRHGRAGLGLESVEGGSLVIDNFGKLFYGRNVYDELKSSGRTWHYAGVSTTTSGRHTHEWKEQRLEQGRWVPYEYTMPSDWSTETSWAAEPIWGGDQDASYVLWLKVNEYPVDGEAQIFDRRVSSVASPTGYRNAKLSLSITEEGRLRLDQTSGTIFSDKKFPRRKWVQLVFVGKAEDRIEIYVDDDCVLATSSQMTFADIPDGDDRYVKSTWCFDYHCSIGTSERYTKWYDSAGNAYGYKLFGDIHPTSIKMNIGGWQGCLDGLAFYNIALSGEQVASMYEAGKSEEAVFTVTQECAVAELSCEKLSFGYQSEQMAISVTLPEYVHWSASNDFDWVEIATQVEHVGSKCVPVGVTENKTTDVRIGELVVANHLVRIEQDGAPAEVMSEKALFDKNGGENWVEVLCADDVVWTALSQCAWIKVMGEAVGTGCGIVRLSVDPLPLNADHRMGHVEIAGHEIRITQNVSGEVVASPITYANLHGTTHANPETYQEGSVVAFTPPNGRTGYTFTGWTPAAITADMTGALTVTAGWRANAYQIAYYANGGTGTMTATDCEYDKEGDVAANGFTRIGYVFLGWATEENGEVVYVPGQPVTNLTSNAGGVIQLYAVWELENVQNPVVTTSDGTIFKTESCTVTITCATEGVDIYYSTNGRTPRMTEANRYKGPFAISDTATIVAVAVKGEKTSEYVEATITKVIPEPLTLVGVLDESKLADVATGGDVEWLPIEDETAKVGGSCAVSGALDESDEGLRKSWLEAKVHGKGTLTFWWRVSCEPDPRGRYTYDFAAFEADDEVIVRKDGESDWVQVSKTFTADGEHVIRWIYNTDGWPSDDYDGCVWVDGVTWSGSAAPEKPSKPTIEGDTGATVTGDAETGFVVKPSVDKAAVEVTIPQGVDAAKVTVEVSPKVASVKLNGAKVKVVSGKVDITEFLNVPAVDGNGVVDLSKAKVKEEIVKETLDPEKGAVIELNAANPVLTTSNTREGLFYQLHEGTTLDNMVNGDSKIGDGKPWSPKITVKGGNSGFYSIGVGKGE